MKVLAFIVFVALMSPRCDCFPSDLKEDQVAHHLLTGGSAPAFVSVPKFKDCLGFRKAGTYRVWCLPTAMPAKCPEESWKKLVADVKMGKC